MKYPKLRELAEAIRSLFSRPYTTKFPYEPHIPEKRFRGKPKYNKEECVGCGACAIVCPPQCIEIIDDITAQIPIRRLILHYDTCIFCGQCERYCITQKGIKLSQEFDLTILDRSKAVEVQESELLVCENCKSVIGTKDHLRFLARKLGPLAYTQPLMILTVESELGLRPEGLAPLEPSKEPVSPLPLRRTDMYKLLCPKCRREVLLIDEWKTI